MNPANGDIYAARADGRFRTESVNPVNDIVLSRSSDGGTIWSSPTRVNLGRTDDYVNHFQPMLAVTPAGEVRVGYRQRGLAANPTDWSWNVDTCVQQATDASNDAFSSAVRVNSVRTDIRFAANQGDRYWLGDYSQMATAGQETAIARAEAYPTSASESKSASWPPTVTHQRIWVSVVR